MLGIGVVLNTGLVFRTLAWSIGEGGAVGVVLNTGLVFGTLTHAYMHIHLYTPIYTYLHLYAPIYIVLVCVDDIC